jgi:hypothetical protein
MRRALAIIAAIPVVFLALCIGMIVAPVIEAMHQNGEG